MTFIIGDRVQETSTTTGTADYDLDGTVTGMQTFVDGVADGNNTMYLASDGTDWEIGYGTVAAGVPNVLTRDTIIDSTNAGSAVSWATGTRDVLGTLSGQLFDRQTLQKSANFSIDANYPNVAYECIGSSGQIVATMPQGATAGSGFTVSIINAGSGTLNVSVRAYGYPTGEYINGSQSGIVQLNAGQAVTMRLLSSEDDWATLGNGNQFVGTILNSGVGRTLLRTTGDADGTMEGASHDVGSGVLARASGAGTAFSDDEDWLITVTSSTQITVKNTTGGTIEYFWVINTTPTLNGSLADDASINIQSLATTYRFYFHAGSVTTGKNICIHGYCSATNFYVSWRIGRGT